MIFFLISDTYQAAKNAGIYPVSLIKEPEAAAMYTLHHFRGKALSVCPKTPHWHLAYKRGGRCLCDL
jgi:hypothetical protein